VSTPPFRVLKFTARTSGSSLVGFGDIQTPSGMILHDVSIHVAGATAWASPASKPMLDRDQNVMRDEKGKIKY
jgi:hypothetical protein